MRNAQKILTIFAAAAVALAPLGLSAAAPAYAAQLTASISPSGVSFTENAATPAFTVTTPPLTSTVANDSYTTISISISTSLPAIWSVNSACPTTDSALSACKISSVKVDGQEVAGVLAKKEARPLEQITLKLPTAVTSGKTVSVSLSSGAFTVGAAGTYSLKLAPRFTADPSQTDSASATLTSVTGGGGGGGGDEPTTPSASITLGAAQGQLVAGSSVAIVASGLQSAAPYSVIVESNPQLLTPADATATNGAVNTTVTLPSNLGAGWHTLTFSSTAADGSAVTSVLYFEISPTGTLLGTSTTKPATLAQTGFDGLPLTAAALALVIVGAGSAVLARRRRTS